jgi:hypothetical protein
MLRRQGRLWDRQTLLLLPLVVVALTAVVMSSCGSGGGDSNGALCEQCGSTDGPCQERVEVEREPDAPAPCNSPAPITEGSPSPCFVELICRRKADSAQQRCFPKDPSSATGEVNFQFRCDGSRAGGTAVPEPTLTPTPAATSVPQECGNNEQEGTEECDGTDLNGASCLSEGCDPGTGSLSCRVNGVANECTFNFEGCNGVCN